MDYIDHNRQYLRNREYRREVPCMDIKEVKAHKISLCSWRAVCY